MISIVIPVYNKRQHLHACLSSVAAQSYADFEVIMVDDGSTDASADICRTYAATDGRFILIRQENGGMSVARNTGIENASGRWIVFLDADDALHPRALELMLKAAVENNAPVAAVNTFRGPSPRWPSNAFVGDALSRVECFSGNDFCIRSLYQHLPYQASVCAKIFDRTLFIESMRFRPGLYYEDLDLSWRLYLSATKVAYIPLKLYFYRDTSGSIINTFNRRRLDVLDVTDRMVSYASASCPAMLPAAADRRFAAHFNMLMLCRRNHRNPAAGIPPALLAETVARCRNVIRSSRRRVLLDSSSRLKNRLGALLSFIVHPF